jgi:hypothetical protein
MLVQVPDDSLAGLSHSANQEHPAECRLACLIGHYKYYKRLSRNLLHKRQFHSTPPVGRQRRVFNPSTHLPRAAYFSPIQTGFHAFNKFSFATKNSSLPSTTRPPRRSDARSMEFVKTSVARLNRKHDQPVLLGVLGMKALHNGTERRLDCQRDCSQPWQRSQLESMEECHMARIACNGRHHPQMTWSAKGQLFLVALPRGSRASARRRWVCPA